MLWVGTYIAGVEVDENQTFRKLRKVNITMYFKASFEFGVSWRVDVDI
jgi:hypothetical protein